MPLRKTILEIGIGGGSPRLPCHTTGHAGPHPAVRRIKLRPHDHRRKADLGKVSIWQSKAQSRRVRDPPRAVWATGGSRRQILVYVPFSKLAESCSSTLPLLPHHRP